MNGLKYKAVKENLTALTKKVESQPLHPTFESFQRNLLNKYLNWIEQLTLTASIVLMFIAPMLIATSIIFKNYLTALLGFFGFCIGEWLTLSECLKMVKRAEKKEVIK